MEQVFDPGKFVLGERTTRHSRGFLLGRNPGFQESRFGVCFVGPAGNELNMFLLRADMQRPDFAVSNSYKYFTADDEPPTEAQYAAHWPILARELAVVQPQVLVTFGGDVGANISKLCGIQWLGLDRHHGIPVTATLPLQAGLDAEVPDAEMPRDEVGIDWLMDLYARAPSQADPLNLVVFPMIHPAAGIHQTSQMALIYDDFCKLSAHLRGQWPARDPHSVNPPVQISVLRTAAEVEASFQTASLWMGLDTEGLSRKPWGLTYSLDGGIGYCIRENDKPALAAFKQCLAGYISRGGKLIIHNSLHDLGVIDTLWTLAEQVWELEKFGICLPEGSYVDSMVAAYLIGRMPQGLKSLSYRFMDVKMRDYDDVVGPYEVLRGRQYMEAASEVDWDVCALCGARAAANTYHPKGGIENIPPEKLRKDGKLRAKFAHEYEECDGGSSETAEVIIDKKGNARVKRVTPIGKRIARCLKEFGYVQEQPEVREESIDTIEYELEDRPA